MSESLHDNMNQTSSVGAVWPPAPAPFERLRGFYDEGVVESAAECGQIAGTFFHFRDELRRYPDLTRLTIRFVARMERLRLLEPMGVEIEAAVPLGGDLKDMAVAYAGYNESPRAVGKARLLGHGRQVRSVARDHPRDPRSMHDRLAALRQDGFTVNNFDRQMADDPEDARESQFLDLYGIFGYGPQDVREILSNPANTIAYAADESNGRLVSTAMAERADIPIAGLGTLSLYEITEASTHPGYRRRALYKTVSAFLLDHVRAGQDADPVHAVYGENNMAMPGVLIAGCENGRQFNHFDGGSLGLHNPGFGFLPQNFHIKDGGDQRPYNDFAVSYVPVNSLEA